MNNRNTEDAYGGTSVAAGVPFRCWTYVIGFNDATAQRGFDPRYEEWEKKEQVYYETGRLYARNIIASGLKPRALPENATIKPLWYAEACEFADKVVGDAKPFPRTAPKFEPEIQARLAKPIRLRLRSGKRIWLPGLVPETTTSRRKEDSP
jgi:hypothetical protein